MAEVTTRGITKRFERHLALDDVTLEFPDGQFFALLGPSGSGKTTLLRAIAGFVRLDCGEVRIGGAPVDAVPVEKRQIGMMFQNYALFPNMSVSDNVGFGLRVRRVGATEERRRVTEALDLVRLGDLGARRPHELSGGQRQRVALARAIVTNPRVLLLDEPLSALDKALRVDMQVELKRIQREIDITTIFVTHDQEEALTLSDRIGILRDGRLVQSGTPREVYDRPGDLFTAQFLGEANILPAALAHELALPKDYTHAVRPEALSLSATRPEASTPVQAVQATLVSRVFAGAMATCLLDVQGQSWKIIARDRDIPALNEGATVWLSWAPKDTMALPGN